MRDKLMGTGEERIERVLAQFDRWRQHKLRSHVGVQRTALGSAGYH